jgi:hypothetical protein
MMRVIPAMACFAGSGSGSGGGGGGGDGGGGEFAARVRTVERESRIIAMNLAVNVY